MSSSEAQKQAAYEPNSELEALLAPYVRAAGPRYRTARWLASDFNATTWKIATEVDFEIDWAIRLPDGELLTSKKHAALCETLKCWLIARTHIDTHGGRMYSRHQERLTLKNTLLCIDYFLLHAQDLKVDQFGLAAITTNDLHAFVGTVASNRSPEKTIYKWHVRLTEFLKQRIDDTQRSALEEVLSSDSELSGPIVDESERVTTLSDSDVLAARAWLASANLYKSGYGSFRLVPRSDRLVAEIYQNTLSAKLRRFRLPPELSVGANFRIMTEYPRARVRSERDARMRQRDLFRITDGLSSLNLLRAERLPAPEVDIRSIRNFAKTLDFKVEGRYRTLPQQVVFSALQKAVEYVLQYGDELVDSFLSLAAKALEAGISTFKFAQRADICAYLGPKCKQLNIRAWSIGDTYHLRVTPSNQVEYYAALRSSPGLYEALILLFGSIQVATGILSARRGGELIDLIAGKCLDVSKTRLLFRNRKSGLAEMRNLEARPIPPIVVRFVALLERLQDGLIRLRAMTEHTHLFAPPAYHGDQYIAALNHSSYNAVLDFFADWAQLPLDKDGRRYYPRQHQFRRFFAMLFFWGGGFGGIDTLRWFLGHTNAEHVWHYITESTPGATIRSVAAEWAAYGVKHNTLEAQVLAEELQAHFGTSDFRILDDEALCLHLEDLIEEGRLKIEPQFLDGKNQYRIAVVLSGYARA